MATSPSVLVATAIAAVALVAVGFLPLFGGPGYEAALAAGLILPSLAACATALDVAAGAPAPFAAFRRGAAVGSFLATVGLAIAWLHGRRIGFCDPVEGTEYFVLGPGAGAIAGGVWGAAAGFLVGGERPRTALVIAAAIAGPVLGVVASLYRFYTSPMVFAFDPFFGFFAGTLYDSVITGLDRLATYRIGTASTLVAVGAFFACFTREPESVLRGPLGSVMTGRKPAVQFQPSPGLLLLAVAGAAGAIFHLTKGPALGHYQTTASIRSALGQAIADGRCELVYPTGTPAAEARALAHECDGHVRQLERFFGVRGPGRVVAFVFATPDQKGRLMGAASTYIAKPWRGEIYIQRAGFPHPVMRHELAHVVAGAFGVGPFKVSGPLGGFIPDPGRIEGVAVAAAPGDEGLSLDEWAKAMKSLGLLPHLDRVFKLSFLGEPSSRAYVVAGAFVDFLRREKGISVVKDWYAGKTIQAASGGKSLGELEQMFLAALDKQTVADDVLAAARARFDRPAIFARRCPHIVDRMLGDANAALAQSDTVHAKHLYEELAALDPHDIGSRLGLAACALREGRTNDARGLYERVATGQDYPKAVRVQAVETLGDIALVQGDGQQATQRYDDASSVVVDVDHRRLLDVKRYAAGGAGREPIVLHVIGDFRLGRDPARAAAALSAWSEREPGLGLADYLLARTYLGNGRFDLAAESLDRAIDKELPLLSVTRQAYKDRIVVDCALGRRERTAAALAAWSKLDGIKDLERSETVALVERCTSGAGP
jgi:tetratricopeptide (TPR) repeat protein